jgi:hypothetical protein
VRPKVDAIAAVGGLTQGIATGRRVICERCPDPLLGPDQTSGEGRD